MAVFPNGYGLGFQVTKAAANLPQTATSTLFTVSGGTVLVQFIAGQVTTAIQNQACTLALGNTPTGASAVTNSLATATAITNKPLGTLFVPSFASGVGGAAVVASVVQANAGYPSAFLCPAGVITWTTSASNTGQMQWYLSYLPVDTGATVS